MHAIVLSSFVAQNWSCKKRSKIKSCYVIEKFFQLLMQFKSYSCREGQLCFGTAALLLYDFVLWILRVSNVILKENMLTLRDYVVY